MQSGDDGSATIVLRNLGSAVMPVELELTLADNSKQTVKLPVEIWYRGDRFAYQTKTAKPVTTAEINPDRTLPDVNRQNNVATAGR